MPPRIFLSDLPNYCLSFYWDTHPDWYVGYRLIEGNPILEPEPVIGDSRQPFHSTEVNIEGNPCIEKRARPPYLEWLTNHQSHNHIDPYQFSFNICSDHGARCEAKIKNGEQSLHWIFIPASDGVWITLELTTQTAISGSYGLQQCLRYTGSYNEYWRRKIAHTPFLSEYDLQALGQPNLTLSYARQNEEWIAFPVPHTVFFTPSGQKLPGASENGTIDHGLIIRQSVDPETAPDWYRQITAPRANWDTISSGMYWENTLYISNRHPADCLHAIIDFGPLKAGQSRKLTGKFYWLEGEKDELLAAWQKDFS